MTIDKRSTARTRARYQRIAPIYDVVEVLAERRYSSWRPKLWSLVKGPKVLEVGVGTGKNMPYYPADAEMTAIDLTPGMLERARKRAIDLELKVDLKLGDAQALDFPHSAFDEVIATFVFCSVPDPVRGLWELARVMKPGGRLLLLEHMRSANPIVGAMMDAFNPLMVRLSGANINRRTIDNIGHSGWRLERVEDMGMGGIFKLIVARRDHDKGDTNGPSD